MKDMSNAVVTEQLLSAIEFIRKLNILGIKDPPPCPGCGRNLFVGPPCCEMEKLKRKKLG